MADKWTGWYGVVDGKPYWEDTFDTYTDRGKPVPTLTIYRTRAEVLKRFQAVRRVKFPPPTGPKL